MVDADGERRAIALFQEMLDVPEAERDAWLAARIGDDARLASRIAAMREADRWATLRTGAARTTLEEETPPERIGAYRIVELIGRGGMGSVYRGERATGDFAHVAAIKVIKPGLLSESLIERFQRERQTLAGLSHPNIAQLYDGGETETGSPYIVMELVDGLPLLQFADERALSRRARLDLFTQICAAVAFAHRNLVVHRDLTPSNVLVTRDGQAKLIDFGIAKPADVEEDNEGVSAAASIASLSLTPGYAAPERMTGARATTTTDVYSLGKVLARLVPPADDDRELRAIVAKATAHDPHDRYPTAEALAADIAALQDGRAVAAVGGGKRYRMGKFVARYRVAVGAAALAVTALVVALVLTISAYGRAEAAREAEAARFAEVRRLANYLLFDLNDRLARTVGNTAARANLADQAQGYLSSLARSPGVAPQIRYEAAIGLIKLARIQGVPSEPNLGEGDRASANLATAARLLTGLAGAPGVAPAPPLAEAYALQSVIFLHSRGEPVRAKALLERAQATLARTPPGTNDSTWIAARRTVRKAELEHADMGDHADQLPALADALERDIARWPPALRNSYAARLDRGYTAHYRAIAQSITGDAKASVPLFLAAEQEFDALLRERPNDPATLYMRSYTALNGFAAASQAGQENVSGRLIRAARDSVDRVLALEPNDDAVQALAANIKEGLSQDLRDNDRYAEAIALQREVVASRRRSVARKPTGRNGGGLGLSLSILGVIGKDAGDRALACDSWREAEARFAALDKRKELLGFFAGFLPGLRANLKRCAAGEPASAFGPLRS